jgi:hypothetical protein
MSTKANCWRFKATNYRKYIDFFIISIKHQASPAQTAFWLLIKFNLQKLTASLHHKSNFCAFLLLISILI